MSGGLLSTDPGTYTVPAALRAHLEARDGSCRFPGCTRPAPRCDVDHTVAWADGGRTTADNLAHLCRRHHVLKHETRWRAHQEPDGSLVWTSPTGRVSRDPVADPVDVTGRDLVPPVPPELPEPPEPPF
ncbi:HNH endonuclease [Isoptericola sp. 4D.3]|uniref:HNH endonuclease n=1 Tax=Isoptericola peretonis TaxID=2918523 RepID=A0ABT0J3J1_9MICO|nr:HNH endonuclease [Isoptericola sp. 4D.3]